MTNDPFTDLEKELPPFIPRSLVSEKLGGWIAPGTLANLDSEGLGPPRVIMGRKVAYPRAGFMIWMRQRSTVVGGTANA